jgi:hypothetical protein
MFHTVCQACSRTFPIFDVLDETVQPARNAVSDYISHTKENMTKIEVSRKRIENDYMLKLNLCTEQPLSDIEGIATTLHGIVDMVKDMHARQINDYKGLFVVYEFRNVMSCVSLKMFSNLLDKLLYVSYCVSSVFKNVSNLRRSIPL